MSATLDCPYCGDVVPFDCERCARGGPFTHEHTWTEIVKRICPAPKGDSVDTYSECTCGAVMHVYTFDPCSIRHVNIHNAGSPGAKWTHAYALGMKTILDETAYLRIEIPTREREGVDLDDWVEGYLDECHRALNQRR